MLFVMLFAPSVFGLAGSFSCSVLGCYLLVHAAASCVTDQLLCCFWTTCFCCYGLGRGFLGVFFTDMSSFPWLN